MSGAVDSWRVSLPCTRAEAEAIDAADDLAIDAVLMTTEEVEDDRERWRLDAYMEREPDAAALAAICALVPSASGTAPTVTALAEQDWDAVLRAFQCGAAICTGPLQNAAVADGGSSWAGLSETA